MLAATRTPTRLAELEGVVQRALEEADLAKAPPRGWGHLQRLTQRHHFLARCISKGMKNYEASAVTGYSSSRISILKNDPMFKELVAAYEEKADLVLASLHEKLAGIAIDAADLIQERIEEEPEKITTNQAMALIELTADRTGFGPSSNHQHNHTVGIADRLEAARRRGQEQRQLELKPVPEKSNGS